MSICSYKLSIRIYLLNILPWKPLSIHFLGCYIRYSSFTLANAGLITHGDICTCLGVILIRDARYILALRVRYVRYTLAYSARLEVSFELARHFESHLARPPPFYMRMRTTISDEHSIVTMLLSTRIIFSTYSFKPGSQYVAQLQLFTMFVLSGSERDVRPTTPLISTCSYRGCGVVRTSTSSTSSAIFATFDMVCYRHGKQRTASISFSSISF